MEPTLQPGDVVLVDTAQRGFTRGDVVAFQTVVHRVLWVDWLGGVWHCGDQPGAQAGRLAADTPRGRVVAAWRGGDRVDLAAGRRGFATRVLLLAGALGRSVVARFW